MLSQPDWLARYGGLLADVRAALQWGFSARGGTGVGVAFGQRRGQISAGDVADNGVPAMDRARDGRFGRGDARHAGGDAAPGILGFVTTISPWQSGGRTARLGTRVGDCRDLQDVDHMFRNLGQLTLYYVRIGDFLARFGRRRNAVGGRLWRMAVRRASRWRNGCLASVKTWPAIRPRPSRPAGRSSRDRSSRFGSAPFDMACWIAPTRSARWLRALWLSGRADEATRTSRRLCSGGELGGSPARLLHGADRDDPGVGLDGQSGGRGEAIDQFDRARRPACAGAVSRDRASLEGGARNQGAGMWRRDLRLCANA